MFCLIEQYSNTSTLSYGLLSSYAPRDNVQISKAWQEILQLYPDLYDPILVQYDELIPKNEDQVLGMRFSLAVSQWRTFYGGPAGDVKFLGEDWGLESYIDIYLNLTNNHFITIQTCIPWITSQGATLLCRPRSGDEFKNMKYKADGTYLIRQNWNRFLIDICMGGFR